MYCPKCGKKVQAGVKVCELCGTAVQMGKSKLLIEEEEEDVKTGAAGENRKETSGAVRSDAAAAVGENKAVNVMQAAVPGKQAKKKRTLLPVIILILILALVGAGIFIWLHFFTYRSVKVEEYDGDVELERKGSDKELFEGMKLIPEDVVTTGEDGLIELFIDSDKHVVAEANTCFLINAVGDENSGKVTIELEYGNALITIEEKLSKDSEFEVRTPNCLCSVRGTVFNVGYDKDKLSTTVEVTEGVVHIKAGDTELDLNAGESLTIREDILPHVNADGYVEFGAYEQDGNSANGPEPIEWEVLDTNEEGILLVSRYVLDGQSYHTEAEDVNWANSSLRQWLNDDFYHAAFTENEREYVRQVTIPNPDNAFWGTPGGGFTHDRVFILSAEEIVEYYPFETWDVTNHPLNGYSSALITAPSEYVKQHAGYVTIDQQKYDELTEDGSGYGTEVIGREGIDWWTRSPGFEEDQVVPVSAYGFGGWNFSVPVDGDHTGVRPALYIPADALNLSMEDVVGPYASEIPVQNKPAEPSSATEITTGHGMGVTDPEPDEGTGKEGSGTVGPEEADAGTTEQNDDTRDVTSNALKDYAKSLGFQITSGAAASMMDRDGEWKATIEIPDEDGSPSCSYDIRLIEIKADTVIFDWDMPPLGGEMIEVPKTEAYTVIRRLYELCKQYGDNIDGGSWTVFYDEYGRYAID